MKIGHHTNTDEKKKCAGDRGRPPHTRARTHTRNTDHITYFIYGPGVRRWGVFAPQNVALSAIVECVCMRWGECPLCGWWKGWRNLKRAPASVCVYRERANLGVVILIPPQLVPLPLSLSGSLSCSISPSYSGGLKVYTHLGSALGLSLSSYSPPNTNAGSGAILPSSLPSGHPAIHRGKPKSV